MPDIPWVRGISLQGNEDEGMEGNHRTSSYEKYPQLLAAAWE
jgi:hypothetical protein